MKNLVSNYINKCQVFLISKYERHPIKIQDKGPHIAKRPFEHIFIDVFTIEKTYFLTMIDLFSKYAQAYKLNDKTSMYRHYKKITTLFCPS